MKIEEKLDKMKISRYKVEKCEISTPHGSVNIKPKNIRNMVVMKDYDTDFLPVFIMDIGFYYKDYFKIVDGVDTCEANITISQYELDKNDENDASKFYIPVIDGTFKLIHDKVEAINDKEFFKADEADDSEEQRDPTNEMFNLEIILFVKRHIENYRNVMNTILKNENIIDTIVYSMCNYGFSGLVQKPDNPSIYPELLVPPNNFLGLLKFLHTEKGIYNKGLITFLDFNSLYIHDKDPCKVWRPAEIKTVTIYISDRGKSEGVRHGTYINKGEELILLNLLASECQMLNEGSIGKEVVGNSLMSINSASSTVNNLKSDLEGKGKKILNDPYNNQFATNSLIHEMNSSALTLQTTLRGINYKVISPNKLFKIIYENRELEAKYGGKYRLSKMGSVFSPSESGEFGVDVTLHLRKIN